MSNTPRSDAIWNNTTSYREEGDLESALYSLCQELERELSTLTEALPTVEGKLSTRAFVCKEHCQKMLDILRPIVQEQMRSDAASSPSKGENNVG